VRTPKRWAGGLRGPSRSELLAPRPAMRLRAKSSWGNRLPAPRGPRISIGRGLITRAPSAYVRRPVHVLLGVRPPLAPRRPLRCSDRAGDVSVLCALSRADGYIGWPCECSARDSKKREQREEGQPQKKLDKEAKVVHPRLVRFGLRLSPGAINRRSAFPVPHGRGRLSRS
jgi:hypothetical protein